MPIHEFGCTSCNHAFEELVPIGGTANCPACGSAKVERRMSLPARPATAGQPVDFSSLGPPAGGCCGGGACGPSH